MRQKGFALMTAVMIGTLLVVIVAAGMAYLIGSGRFLSAGQSRATAYNAAQAGVAWGIANFDSGAPTAIATTDVSYGQAHYALSVTDAPGEGYILTASGWLPQDPAQRRILRTIIQPTSTLAQYAIAAGGSITLQNHTYVASRPAIGLGDVRANGDVTLAVHSSTDGTAAAAGSCNIDDHSHAWAGSTAGTAPITLPTYTTAQILQFQAAAEASQSVQIPEAPLAGGPGGWGPEGLIGTSPDASGSWGPGPGGWWVAGSWPATLSWAPLPGEQIAGACGGSGPARICGPQLAGYYYSSPGYDVTTPQTDGLVLELRRGNYTLDGLMFVAGKLLIHDGTTITGQGKILATEGISIRDHVAIYGATQLSHVDLVSLYGDIEIRHHSVLGQLHSGFAGRRGDPDALTDLQDRDDPTGRYSASDDGQLGLDDAVDRSYRSSVLPLADWLAMGAAAARTWLLPPAYADDDKSEDGGDNPGQGSDRGRKAAPQNFTADLHGADQEHADDWQARYSISIPVGCTVWAQSGNVRFFEHSTLLGNIIAAGTVTMSNHCDLVRNSADPVLSVGLESWKAFSFQTVR